MSCYRCGTMPTLYHLCPPTKPAARSPGASYLLVVALLCWRRRNELCGSCRYGVGRSPALLMCLLWPSRLPVKTSSPAVHALTNSLTMRYVVPLSAHRWQSAALSGNSALRNFAVPSARRCALYGEVGRRKVKWRRAVAYADSTQVRGRRTLFSATARGADNIPLRPPLTEQCSHHHRNGSPAAA